MAEKAKLTAEERLKKIEQKRAKLAEEAAKIRKEARKKEASAKMKLGGLVWKAGLQDQPDNVILGILVAGFEKLGTESGAFEAIGRKKFENDAKAKAESKMKSQETKPRNPGHGAGGATPHSAASAAERFYLNVPIEEKDAAKALGARWDAEHKKWWCHPADKEKFTKWWPAGV
ncbi:DUF5710 domain-containing protein [Solidesulfovibrio sp. C21]|uniref:DUF5710 domain-containing protein n=1 Tax=Solidesulfovibrio sp. C21 TaxID=3398613 RepID=UPI0039FC68FA